MAGSPRPESPPQATDSAQTRNPSRRRAVKRDYPARPGTMNGPLYMQASNNVVLVRRVKRRGEGPMRQLARWFVENQIGLATNLLALLFLAHTCMPKARSHTTKFVSLAYHNPHTGRYGAGRDDSYLISFFTVLFTGLRAATMEYVLAPFAKRHGIAKKKDIARFSEQAWMLIYYIFFWSLGLYIYCNSPYYLNLPELWTNWPSREIEALMKAYILAQLAFWFQQVIVINIEERRKDHWQMLTHHLITICLLYGSYRYHHTRVGNLVLVLMDFVDILLPLAKCLKYLGFTRLCDIAFGVFMISWFFTRHIFYNAVCWSVYAHSPKIVPPRCFEGPAKNLVGPIEPSSLSGIVYLFEPLWNSQGIVCFNKQVKWGFLFLLLFLQALTLIWFSMIIKVAIKVIRGSGAEDMRSDDEADGLDDEEDVVYEAAQPLEQEVGVDQLNLKGWERRNGVKRQTPTATAVSLPGHSDRKELLGRIGCEKQVE